MRKEIRLQIFRILSFMAMFTFAGSLVAQEGINEKPGDQVVIMNHQEFPKILEEFQDGCVYYQVDFEEKLNSLEAIRLVPGDLGFLGRVQGNRIEVNQELIKYPNLLRLVTLRQLGKFLGLPEQKNGREIMSETWSLSIQEELYAFRHRQRPYQREHFFEALAEKFPLEKEI